MTSTLVIQTSYLGDAVLTTPLLSQMANRGPVDVVVTPASAALLVGHPAVREVIVYDKRKADRGIPGFLRLVARLRRSQYDVALLAQGSWRSSALALLAGIPQRLGFSTSAGRLLYTKRVQYRDDLHHAARLLMLARPNGREPTPEELRPSLHPGEDERSTVNALLSANGVVSGKPLVAVAPGSVWGTKRWPFYPELAFALEGIARVVIIGSKADAGLARAILDASPRVIDATGKLTLLESAELIGRASVLVTNDSAPEHLASAMNTPTIAIFGPTITAFGFGPLADERLVLGVDGLPCRPCDRHGPMVCPLGHHKCMRDLRLDTVETAVRKILAGITPA